MSKNSYRIRALVIIALSSVVFAGCTSFRSTIMQRLDNDSLVSQVNPRQSRGVPVRLKVPSHLAVTITESYQIVNGYQSGNEIESPFINVLQTNQGRRVVDVATNLEYTDKVFTVDFPRPISGSLNLGDTSNDGLVFDGEQYFAAIRGSVDDDTLEDLNSVISTQLPKLRGASGSKTSTRPEAIGQELPVEVKTRVVAFQRFDISECDWERKVQDFIDLHMNHCEAPHCEPQLPPGVQGSGMIGHAEIATPTQNVNPGYYE